MNIEKAINPNLTGAMSFPLSKESLAAIVESRRLTIEATRFIQPVLKEFARAQQDIFAHIMPLIEAQDSWRKFALERSSLHFLEEINAGVKASTGMASLATSLVRQNMFIELNTAVLKIPEMVLISESFIKEVIGIRKAFLPTLEAFASIRESLLQKSYSFAALRIPVREHFLTTDLLHELADVEEPEEFSEERAIAIKETDEQLLITLPEALERLNPELLQLWRGAWDSLLSKNPDKIRHTLTSARELMTQVLHELSPDKMVRAWSSDTKHYKDDRPTRKARLLFICNQINDEKMKNYFDKEIGACIELIELFQQGTHEVAPSFNDIQLQTMLRKVHSTICTLVEIHKAKSN